MSTTVISTNAEDSAQWSIVVGLADRPVAQLYLNVAIDTSVCASGSERITDR